MSENDQPRKQDTQPYFFPNTKEGLPFSCEAVSENEAIEANQHYLKQQKETQ